MTTAISFEEKWAKLEEQLTERFGKKPNMEAILFLIGVNEYRGRIPKIKFSKEQKQDLMHIAVCSLLASKGYYAPEGYDEEGWPHFTELKKVEADTLGGQERLLQEAMLSYFEIQD